MSDFTMGAEVRLTDNFSQPFSNMAQATSEFESGAASATQTVDGLTSSTDTIVGAISELADIMAQAYGVTRDATRGATALSDAEQDVASSIRESTEAVEDMVTPVTEVTRDTNVFRRTLQQTTGNLKDFAKTKISNITTGFRDFKARVTEGHTGTRGLLTSLKNVAKVSLSGLHSGLSKVGSLATSAGSKIASGLGSAIKGVTKGLTIGIAAAGTAMAGLTVKALNLGGELEQNIGGSEAVFKEFATTMQETGKTAFSEMGLSQSDFLATANKMGALFQGSGFGIKESADLSSKAMQRASDVASIMGIDVGDAMEAVAGAAKGNFTMMDNLGVAMNDTSIAAYAASKGIKKTSQQMTQQEKIGLAMEMFLDKTTYAVGNYAKENETLSGSLNTAKAAFSNFMAGSGSVDDLVSTFVNATTIIVDNVTEIVPRLATGVAEAIGAIMPKVPGILIGTLPMLISAATQMFQSLITTVQDNKAPLIGLAVTVVSSLATFLLDAIPQILLVGIDILLGLADGITQQLPRLIPVAMQAISSFVEGIISRLPLLIQTALQLIQTLVDGLIANLPAILQVALQLVVALAVGLAQAIPQLVAVVPQLVIAIIDTIMSTNWLAVGWDIVKGVGKGLMDGIKGFFGGGEKGGKEVADGAAAGIQNNMGTVSAASLATADTVTAGLQPDYGTIGDYGVTATTTLADSFTENSPIAVDAATGITTEVTDTFNTMDLFPTGKNAMEGLNEGLLSMKSTVMATARSMANSIKNEINSALDIHSPSRVMEESGEYTGEGLIVGITNMISRVKDAARSLGDSMIEPIATQSTSQVPINPSGAVSTPTTRTEGLKIMIENIILSDVGDKDPKALVAEILKLLYEALSGADEVLSAGEMGALLA